MIEGRGAVRLRWLLLSGCGLALGLSCAGNVEQQGGRDAGAGAGSGGGAGECREGERRCHGVYPQHCDDQGKWQGFKACDLSNARATCVGRGDCEVSGCEDDWGDCDGEPSNGCEAHTPTTQLHCGACGKACQAGEVCAAGKCAPAPTSAPSCAMGGDGRGSCGPGHDEDCCQSLLVEGGDTIRLSAEHSATVSSFRLDKFEVTVGRFRGFVEAWVGGWRPAEGSGKHEHLHSGRGLRDAGAPPSYEPGWLTAWNAQLPATRAEWGAKLANKNFSTWTTEVGPHELRPVNYVTWYELYAFCIWDGGFLPSELEWRYVEAGGGENRAYPWGNEAARDQDRSLGVWGCNFTKTGECTDVTVIAFVGSVPGGNARWGQSDVMGNVLEWVYDWHEDPFPKPLLTDYATVTELPRHTRVYRGSSYLANPVYLYPSGRGIAEPESRSSTVGGRCARVP